MWQTKWASEFFFLIKKDGFSLIIRVLKCFYIVNPFSTRTPLMLAVLGGHTDCVHYLLEKGALSDAKDKRGCTALHRGVGQHLPLLLNREGGTMLQ